MCIQAAASASAEMLALLKAEHSADSVQVLGPCEGSIGAGKASAEAFKALHEGREGASKSRVSIDILHVLLWVCVDFLKF
jgi:hypothetical protein